ncbi:hypothetical protein Godav_029999 [Gossypium davidsonii]|uniref:Uncharacterized protein n=1 Tax=Gossypium davidsonii TaxID=34287 RepID=A0A7J8THV2_GOSDV|nr:hypothetical protein [Gossypium davidsonii]
MERLNSNLYLQNCYIMKENERLRKKAQLLNQENQALLSELKQKLSKANNNNSKGKNSATSNGPLAFIISGHQTLSPAQLVNLETKRRTKVYDDPNLLRRPSKGLADNSHSVLIREPPKDPPSKKIWNLQITMESRKGIPPNPMKNNGRRRTEDTNPTHGAQLWGK